jgi:hypothetical protein
MRWLAADRQGLVIIRARAAPFYLDHLQAVLAEDPDHSKEVAHLLYSSRDPHQDSSSKSVKLRRSAA